ncbi:sigma-70 family RNA polymerase sigma factor [Anaerovorax odorimutans]|uniref:sigma-70 family RNA polymerase sigma factor n=1 Tax=Anaerovorax odorimutans TaxID=109327 RepID=UPI00041EAE80|nr:sigma-70 family RNA polymerase sigma factor [Anaerovorax odorimutans]
MNDDQIILLLENSPSKGLEAAINQYGDLVKWITLKIIGNNQQDLEECVSDTFVRLWQSIHRFDKSKNISLKNYLCGIARHTALDYRRKIGRSGDLLPLEEVELKIDTDIADEISNNINAEIIKSAIDSLPPPDKEIFIYRYYFYEKISDIAGRLSIDAKTVENKLYRGRKKLKTILEKGGIII